MFGMFHKLQRCKKYDDRLKWKSMSRGDVYPIIFRSGFFICPDAHAHVSASLATGLGHEWSEHKTGNKTESLPHDGAIFRSSRSTRGKACVLCKCDTFTSVSWSRIPWLSSSQFRGVQVQLFSINGLQWIWIVGRGNQNGFWRDVFISILSLCICQRSKAKRGIQNVYWHRPGYL